MDQSKRLAHAAKICQGTLMETLGIEFTQITDDTVVATMPVKPTIYQPEGIMHGGASVSLAESIGSLGSHMYVFEDGFTAVGLEINANHVRSVKSGMVTGTGRILHKGRKTHIWEIIIRDEAEKNVAICRMTNMIIPRK